MAAGLLLAAALAGFPAKAANPDPNPAQLEHGKYLVQAGACASCHTDARERGGWLAGGRTMHTPFGDYHTPNITPDPETGIGDWTEEEFVRAMTEGVSPDGAQYYPLFPYPWYRNLTREDLSAMWAYLRTVPPVRREVKPHDISFPYSVRPLILGWKLVNLPGAPEVGTHDDPLVARGDYIVNALGHCAACHTPTLPFWIYKEWQALGGQADIPGAYAASNITPDPETGIGRWSEEDMLRALVTGMRPNGYAIRGPMADYVADSSRFLTREDLRAVNAYLRTVPPIRNPIPAIDSPYAHPEAHEEAPMGSAPLGSDLVLGKAVAMGAVTRPEHACYRCHLVDGTDPASDGMPRLDGQGAAYLAWQLDAYAGGTRPSPIMAAIAKELDAAERSAVAAYYASLPSPPVPQVPPRSLEQHGRRLALEGDPSRGLPACINCHGVLGLGVPPGFPYLAGQDALYMELQLALWRSGERRNDLLGSMAGIARRLSPADSRAVSAYFEGLAHGHDPAAATVPLASRSE